MTGSTVQGFEGDGTRESARGFWASWATLLASSSTLICCALPALLVTLGAGAVMGSLVSAVPQLVWVSQNKLWFFGAAGLMLAAAGWLQWHNRNAPCPIDPALRESCTKTRRISRWVYWASVGIYAVGGWFAFVMPWLMSQG